MGILIETFVGGMFVFLVTYIITHWRQHTLASPCPVSAMQKDQAFFMCQIILEDKLHISVKIEGTQDEQECKAIFNVIDKALLAWRMDSAA